MQSVFGYILKAEPTEFLDGVIVQHTEKREVQVFKDSIAVDGEDGLNVQEAGEGRSQKLSLFSNGSN